MFIKFSLSTNMLSEINNCCYSFLKWKLPTGILQLDLIKKFYQKRKIIYNLLQLSNKIIGHETFKIFNYTADFVDSGNAV